MISGKLSRKLGIVSDSSLSKKFVFLHPVYCLVSLPFSPNGNSTSFRGRIREIAGKGVGVGGRGQCGGKIINIDQGPIFFYRNPRKIAKTSLLIHSFSYEFGCIKTWSASDSTATFNIRAVDLNKIIFILHFQYILIQLIMTICYVNYF